MPSIQSQNHTPLSLHPRWCQENHDATLLFPPFHSPLNNDAPSPAYPFLCLCVRSMLSLEMGDIVYKLLIWVGIKDFRYLSSTRYRDDDEEETEEQHTEQNTITSKTMNQTKSQNSKVHLLRLQKPPNIQHKSMQKCSRRLPKTNQKQ